jgi:4-amino-4-deoxy-L-arabinose transferase-like glycosyltransferase
VGEWAAIVVAGVVGLGLRIAVLAGPLGRPNADEVLTALMARHLPSDGFPVFVWGQHYGGTAELLPVALSLRVFGWSATSLHLPDIGLAAAIAVLVWRLAIRVVDRRVALAAGLVAWVFPGTALWFGLREQLFYPLTVVLGLAMILVAYRIPVALRAREFAGLGLLAGLAFWTSPFCVWFVGPAAVVAVVGIRRRAAVEPAWMRRVVVGGLAAALGAVVGALPWLVDNGRSGWASLHAGDGFAATGSYPDRVRYALSDGLPGVLGLRQVFTRSWVLGPIGVFVYMALLVLIVTGIVLAARRWRLDGTVPWDALGFVLFPFVFALFPFAENDPIYRYAFFVAPFAVTLAVRPIGLLRAPGRGVVVAVVATCVLCALTLQQLYVVTEVDRAAGIGAIDLAPAMLVLEQRGIDAVFADYWIAYRVTFDSEERIIGAPTSGIDRYPPYDAEARAAASSAWVVTPGPQQDALLAYLQSTRTPADVVPAGDVTVVVPARPVDPAEVPPAAKVATS